MVFVFNWTVFQWTSIQINWLSAALINYITTNANANNWTQRLSRSVVRLAKKKEGDEKKQEKACGKLSQAMQRPVKFSQTGVPLQPTALFPQGRITRSDLPSYKSCNVLCIIYFKKKERKIPRKAMRDFTTLSFWITGKLLLFTLFLKSTSLSKPLVIKSSCSGLYLKRLLPDYP